ncbi:MAG: hypothetical protein J6Z36_00640 [Clostridia bacterium]|nr:hypothetical protein [Clostridia bacterium]
MSGKIRKQNNEFLRLGVKTAAWFLTALAFFAAVWFISYRAVGNEYILPSLGDTFKEVGAQLASSAFWNAFVSSFLRALQAFVFAFLFAVILAIISYMVPSIGSFLAPIVTAMRALPTMAILLMLLIWSTPSFAPVVVAFLALFPLLYTATGAALNSVDKKLVEMSKIYRVPLHKRVFQMY